MLWNPKGWNEYNYETDDFLRTELTYKENGDLVSWLPPFYLWLVIKIIIIH